MPPSPASPRGLAAGAGRGAGAWVGASCLLPRESYWGANYCGKEADIWQGTGRQKNWGDGHTAMQRQIEGQK